MQDQSSGRACDSCSTEQAAWRHPVTREWLCVACGLYAAGRDEGEAAAARELLSDAIVALRGLGLEESEILTLVHGQLSGDVILVGLERDQIDQVRVWASRLEIIHD